MTAGLPLMKSVLTSLAKSGLIILGLSAGLSAADAAIEKKKSQIWNYSINIFKLKNGSSIEIDSFGVEHIPKKTNKQKKKIH